MEKQEIISSGLLEMYVLGATSSDETNKVQEWRAMFSEVNDEIISIEKSFEAYAFAHAIASADTVKQNIFNKIDHKINSVAQTAKLVSISPKWKMAAAAAILLLIGSSVLNFFYYNKYNDVSSKYDESQQQIASLNQHLTDLDKDMGIVQSKYSEPVSLKGLEAAPDAAAKIFWMKNTGEVYVDPTNLPMAPAGKQYQLWAIVDGKPVDGGMISSKDGKKYSIQKMKTFGKAQAFAITLETEGGNPQPKGQMYVMGEI